MPKPTPLDVHFECKTKDHFYYRKVQLHSSRLTLTIGRTGDAFHRAVLPFRSATAARLAANEWVRIAREQGFAEADLNGATSAQVTYLQGAAGPGRARADGPIDDVYFGREAAGGRNLQQGERILCQGIRKNPRLKIDWMFGSRLEAANVAPMVGLAWIAHKKRSELSSRDRGRLAGMYQALLDSGTVRLGRLAGARSGDLILSYEKGVHRLINIERRMVHYETVLTSRFKRRLSPPNSCAIEFCAPVPPALAKAIRLASGRERS